MGGTIHNSQEIIDGRHNLLLNELCMESVIHK